VHDVLLFLDVISPTHVLPDNTYNPKLTLRDCGVLGTHQDDPAGLPHVTLYYDFPPLETECPLLQNPPYEVTPVHVKPPHMKDKKEAKVKGGVSGLFKQKDTATS